MIKINRIYVLILSYEIQAINCQPWTILNPEIPNFQVSESLKFFL